MPQNDESVGETPQSVDQLERALEDGRCFRWEYYSRRLYFEFVETVGPVVTETDEHGDEPFTNAATYDEMKTALRYDGVEEIDCEEIPVTEESA